MNTIFIPFIVSTPKRAVPFAIRNRMIYNDMPTECRERDERKGTARRNGCLYLINFMSRRRGLPSAKDIRSSVVLSLICLLRVVGCLDFAAFYPHLKYDVFITFKFECLRNTTLCRRHRWFNNPVLYPFGMPLLVLLGSECPASSECAIFRPVHALKQADLFAKSESSYPTLVVLAKGSLVDLRPLIRRLMTFIAIYARYAGMDCSLPGVKRFG